MHDDDTTARAAPSPAPATPTAQRYPIAFHGTGAEYFRIWIVNLLLTLLTLGIYSAWAKVRKLQYFYRNTELDGSVFDYHGRPQAILKGRIVAVLLLGFYNLAFRFSPVLGLVAMALLAALLPWLLTQSQKFRLHNSSYRGLRFRFTGPVSEAYLIWGMPMVLFMLPIGLLSTVKQGDKPPIVLLAVFGVAMLAIVALVPYLHYRVKRFQHAFAHFGRSASLFRGKASRFYGIYALAALLLIGFGAVAGIVAGLGGVGAWAVGGKKAAVVIGVVFVIVVYASGFAITPFINARVQNYVWNHSLLGLVGFDSAVKARRLMLIYVTNVLLILLTFGLYIPFAVVRMLKYRLTAVTVLSTTGLQGFIARQGGVEVGAAGEGAADLLDFDFSL